MAGAMAALAAAALDLDGGEPAAAAERALSAAAALEEVGNVFDAATSRLLAGRALAEAGERDRAAAELELAAAAFESFGSHRYRRQAERELRKLGRSIHRRTRPGKADGSGVDSLTERELRSHDSSSTARPTLRSRPSSSSARRPSKPTCATPSASSASHPASKSRAPSSAPIGRRSKVAFSRPMARSHQSRTPLPGANVKRP